MPGLTVKLGLGVGMGSGHHRLHCLEALLGMTEFFPWRNMHEHACGILTILGL